MTTEEKAWERAKKLAAERKPYLLIGPPICTQFSACSALSSAGSPDTAAAARTWKLATVLPCAPGAGHRIM